MAIDATVAGLQANSYVTLDEAQEYFSGRLDADGWEQANDDRRERALITACRHIEALRLRSHRRPPDAPAVPLQVVLQLDPLQVYDNDQALGFPRSRDITVAGVYFVPGRVKQAQCEEALSLLAGDGDYGRRAALQAQGVTSFAVDGLSETYAKGAGAAGLVGLQSPQAQALIAPFLERTGIIATSPYVDGEFSPGSKP